MQMQENSGVRAWRLRVAFWRASGCLQVSGDNGEVWGGYGGRVRSVALATTRDCSGFDPLVFAGLAAAHFAMFAAGVMSN